MTGIPSEANMATIQDASTRTPDLPLSQPGASGSAAPARFYQRFGDHGHVGDPGWPRITTQESDRPCAPRRDGLRVLFINAPIREWSYPNILPIGHAYVGAVAAMDGHTVDVLDLNAERREPIKGPLATFVTWVEARVVEKLERGRPDVIGLGGIITQYSWIKRLAERSEEHTSELQSQSNLVCRLLLEKKKKKKYRM